jgi:hypothetical protein
MYTFRIVREVFAICEGEKYPDGRILCILPKECAEVWRKKAESAEAAIRLTNRGTYADATFKKLAEAKDNNIAGIVVRFRLECGFIGKGNITPEDADLPLRHKNWNITVPSLRTAYFGRSDTEALFKDFTTHGSRQPKSRR